MRSKRNSQELEQRRLQAIKLLNRGHRPADVAREMGYSAGALSQWKKRFGMGGRRALLAKPHPGPAQKLSPAQQKQLVRLLTLGPYGRPGRWTLRRVQEAIQREFGIRLDPSSVFYMLRRREWIYQRGTQATPDEMQAWRQLVYAAAAEEVGPDGQTLGLAKAMLQHPSPSKRGTWVLGEKPRKGGASRGSPGRRTQQDG